MKAGIVKQDASTEEDVRLVVEFQSGNEAAFTELVRRHEQFVFNLIFHYIGRKNEVEDLAQEVFVKIYLGLHKFESRSSFRSWLYRVSLNACIDHSRKQKLRRMVSLEGLTEWAKDRLSSRQPGSGSPEDSVARSELEERITIALERLPAGFKQVLVLRDMEGLEYEEIAQIIGTNLGTVKSRLFRARQRMREFLKPYLEAA